MVLRQAQHERDETIRLSIRRRRAHRVADHVDHLFNLTRIVAFGHVGDGNVHYDVLKPVGGDDDAHDALREQGARIVHDITAAFSGSISAEHGLGAMKTGEALTYKDPVEVAALRAIRAALDPRRIMNPRVLF